MADAAAPGLLPVAADRERDKDDRRRWMARCGFAVLGIMSTLLVYGVLQVGSAARSASSLLAPPPPPFLLPSYTHSSPNPLRTETSARGGIDRCLLICRLECSVRFHGAGGGKVDSGA